MNQSAPRPVCLRDIARSLGVTAATVSLALNDSPRLSQATRERVREAAHRMGYQRSDAVSRALRSVRSGGRISYRETVACLSARESLDSYFAPAARRFPERLPAGWQQVMAFGQGIRERALELGYGVDFFTLRENSPDALRRVFRARGIGSLVFYGPGVLPETLEDLLPLLRGYRCVVLGPCEITAVSGTVVGVDLFTAGRRAYIEAWKAGYRQVCYVELPMALDPERRFEAGLRFASNNLREQLPLRVIGPGFNPGPDFLSVLRRHGPETCFIGGGRPDFYPAFAAERSRHEYPGWIDWHANLRPEAGPCSGIDQRDLEQGRRALEFCAAPATVGQATTRGAASNFLLEPDWIVGSTLLQRRTNHLNLLKNRPYRQPPATSWSFVSLGRAKTTSIDPSAGWRTMLRLPAVAPGEWVFHGVPFRLEPARGKVATGAIMLRSARYPSEAGRALPSRVSIPVGRRAAAVYFFHACGYTPEPEPFARYRFLYADGSAADLPLVPPGNIHVREALPARFGAKANIQDWCPHFHQMSNRVARPVCLMDFDRRPGEIGYFYILEWENPHPRKPIERVVIESDPAGPSMLLVFAITVAG